MPDLSFRFRSGLAGALLASLACLAASSPAAAQPAAAEACVAIESDAERLLCYDSALRRPPPPAIDPLDARLLRIDPSLLASDLYPDEVQARGRAASLLDARWELHPQSKLGTFNLRAHRPVVLLPLFYATRPNQLPQSPNPANSATEPLELEALENKFQLSFKTKVLQDLFGGRADLWFGFTQSSRWQLYSSRTSRPFRETNYEPEALLIAATDLGFGDWRLRMLGAGFVHQSNGRSLPQSRSWDRALLDIGIEREGWVVELRPWWRIPESRRKDDNPDIEDFLGRGDLRVVHHRGDHEFALMLRHSLRGGERSHGAWQFDWSFPLHRYLRGHLQLFDGYGESMIDYNHRASYLGLGVSLLRWY
jgi:phospholipase A1/A2